MHQTPRVLKSLEICAGAGGQALGIEQAGFEHVALVEIDHDACMTLRNNRPNWNVIEGDIKEFNTNDYRDIELLAGGIPCPPFSIAGKQLGYEDERDLFPQVIRLTKEIHPKAIMIENVKGIMSSKFASYRKYIIDTLNSMGYECDWKMLNACDYGVPQYRVRALLVAFLDGKLNNYSWPKRFEEEYNLGELLYEHMAKNGWKGAKEWSKSITGIAPTIVGGSKKHGGADLGPTRSRMAWKALNVDGAGIANESPTIDNDKLPKLTIEMVSLIQGFPPEWRIHGKKTAAYRQIGNAFPPPMARAVATEIKKALLI